MTVNTEKEIENMCWTVNEIKKGVWHVDESGLNAMYVVKGSKMSAVIDAGTGIGDFKGW